jgi:hypothetical protein
MRYANPVIGGDIRAHRHVIFKSAPKSDAGNGLQTQRLAGISRLENRDKTSLRLLFHKRRPHLSLDQLPDSIHKVDKFRRPLQS